MQLGRYLILFLMTLLVGCAGASRHTDPVSVGPVQNIAPGIALRLPATPPFGADVTAQQLVQARYRNRTEVFQALIESSSGRFTIVLTVPYGPRIMRIDWTANGIAEKREAIAPSSLSARRLLADLALVYAPENILRRNIEGAELVAGDDGGRKLERNGETVVEVERPLHEPWNARARLVNHAYGYTLDIQSRLMVSP